MKLRVKVKNIFLVITNLVITNLMITIIILNQIKSLNSLTLQNAVQKIK